MPRKTLRETPIERIYREVTGHKMPYAVRIILQGKPGAKPKRQVRLRH
jgi:hypothetical protein